MPVVLALLLGFQHALAMLAGIISRPMPYTRNNWLIIPQFEAVPNIPGQFTAKFIKECQEEHRKNCVTRVARLLRFPVKIAVLMAVGFIRTSIFHCSPTKQVYPSIRVRPVPKLIRDQK